MTEPVEVAIAQSMYAWLQSAPGTLGATPRAAPFVTPPYTPVDGTIYLDVSSVLRAAPEHFGLDIANIDILNGIYQVTVVAPLGPGELPGLRVASLVRDRFDPKNLTGANRLTANGKWLDVTALPTIAAAVKDAPWVRFPVSIPYQLFS